jgi:molybdopterin-guanine dinucleotide biosynthesis protein B
MKLIGITGWSGAGKTTLIARLLPVLAARGVSVSTIKHAHHGFDIDLPGKDSHTHRLAGAQEVLVSSARRFALIHEVREPEEEWRLPQLLARLSPVNLVIIEGFKAEPHPKIEVWRMAGGKPPRWPEDRSVRVLVSDGAVAEAAIPVLGIDDLPAIAEACLRFAAPVAQIFPERG